MTDMKSASFWIGLVAIVLPGPVAIPPEAYAQQIGDPTAGRQIAEGWCTSCHVVAPASELGTSTGAPTFAAIARMKSTTPMSIRAFLLTPHARMPDLHLSRDEIDNLAAYIVSLRRR